MFGDVIASAARGGIRLLHSAPAWAQSTTRATLGRAPKLPARSLARAADRLSLTTDVADAYREASSSDGNTTKWSVRRAASLARTFATSFASGYALFAVYEDAAERGAPPAASGAAAGVVSGALSAALESPLSGWAGARLRPTLRLLPRAAALEAVSMSVWFGVYDAAKGRALAADTDGGVRADDVARVLAAGCVAGVASEWAQALSRAEAVCWRTALRSAPVSALGLGAWELGKLLGAEEGGTGGGAKVDEGC